MGHTIEDLKLVESRKLFSSINWEAVHNIFYTNDWRYGLEDLKVPSIEELKDMVLGLIIGLEKIIFRDGLPKKEGEKNRVSSGRFTMSVDDLGLMQLHLDIGNVYIDD